MILHTSSNVYRHRQKRRDDRLENAKRRPIKSSDQKASDHGVGSNELILMTVLLRRQLYVPCKLVEVVVPYYLDSTH
jgi:hypothetical protein